MVPLNLPPGTVNESIAANSNGVLASGGTGYFTVTLSGVPSGYDVANGPYNGWCGDYQGVNSTNSLSGVTLISTYSPLIPTPPAKSLTNPNPWASVNYLLNNKTLLGAITPSVLEVQTAIWMLLTNTTTANVSANVTALITAGLANSSFQPGPGQVIAVDAYKYGFQSTGGGRTGPYQDLIIEVPLPTGAIGDYVWQDSNQNGIQDAGEPGINGVTVDLCAATDSSCASPIATALTGTYQGLQGHYEFTGLDLNTYWVYVNPSQSALTGLVPTQTGQGTPATDSNLNPSETTLTSNAPVDLTQDFGFTSPGASAIGDFVWDDSNGNGLQDAGEAGIPSVTVNLCADSGCSKILATTTTDQNGAYHFTGLLAGTYYVSVVASTLPPGFVASPSMVGTDTTIDSNGSPATVVLPENTTDNTIDFGYVPPAQGAIGDFVWHDLNRNGIQDSGEPGINGVTVRLYNSSNTLIGTTTTVTYNGNDGYYQFTGLAAGSYTVVVDSSTLPPGYTATTSNAIGSTTANDSNGSPAAVTLATNTSVDETIDFGYLSPCAGVIGDFVWYDANENGIQDSGEAGIPGVTLYLRNTDNSLVQTTTTDANGNYQFTGVCAGTYLVSAAPPLGYTASPANASGSTTANDSNPNPSTVVLGIDQTDDTIDFGFYQSGTVNQSCSLVNNGNPGEVNVPFSAAAPTITLGTGPYTFSVIGTLPAGLTLNSDGSISGTPTASGTFSVQALDVNHTQVYLSCPITIVPPPVLACASSNTGELGVAFDSGLPNVSGGASPYTFAIIGTLPTGLTLDSTTGEITGTPTTTGSFSLQVSDSAGGTAATTCPITIVSGPALSCAATNSGEVGVAFNSGVPSVTGGVGPFTYSIVGALPAGLTLNANGSVSGTPTAAGSFSVQVKDANNQVATGTCPITIVGAPSLACAATNSGEVGVAFNSGAPAVTGGVAPYTFSIVGTLPAGLTLNSDGSVSGTPTASGSFSVQVKDANNQVASGSCPITIIAAPSLACAATSSGEVGVAFNSGVPSVTGGLSPYTYSIVGTLPAGLTLNANGSVTGTPTAAGAFSVAVTDSNHQTSTQTCPITIVGGPSLACSATSSGEVKVAFNSGIPSVTGGVGPYTFSIVGTLPAGLTLNANGSVTGTPTATGSFSVQVTDSNHQVAVQTCPISIVSGPTANCAVITAVQGVAITPVTLTATGGSGSGYTFTASGLPAGLSMSSGGTISGTPTVNGTFNYTVTVKDGAGSTSTLNCSVTVAPPVSATCVSITATQGVAITPVTLTATGGTGTGYTFTATGLPAGISISSAGKISGTPTVSGTFPYTVTVKDSAGNTGTLNCSVTVGTNTTPLSVTCAAGTAVVGTAYSSSVTASGGVPPYTFSVAVGSLPPGLTLSTSTGAITGTPTSAGTYGFTIQVKDSAGTTAFSSCSGSCSVGVTSTWSFASPVGQLGNSQTYTVGGITITAYGYTSSGTAANLYGQTVSGNEYGLGVYGSGSSNNNYWWGWGGGSNNSGTANEIDTTHFVQLDISAVLAAHGTNGKITVNSVQCSESYSIYGSNTLGSLGTLLAGNLTGDNNAITIPNLGSYKYISVIANSGNVLLASVSFTLGNCQIVVSAAIDLQCGSCGSGNATVGQSYSSTLAVVNGVSPYTFSIVSGSLPPGLTLNTTTGKISGTPTTAGTYTFTSKVVDAKGNTDTQTCTIKVVSLPIDLQCGSCGSSSNANVGSSYSATLAVVNGTAPYTFSITSGSLPPGLTLNAATGVISGTPTTAGTYTFTSKVVDAGGNTDTQTCTIHVTAPPINLECGACGSSGSATVGTAYSTTFSLTGGSGSYTYSVISGSLPPGLTLSSSTGKVTGTPTASGTYTFTIKVSDNAGNSDTTTCTIKVTGSTVTLACGSCSSSSKATVGVSYSATLSASGGTSPYTYSIASGSLPPGLSLSSSGSISGKPTTAGTYSFTTKVVDKNGKTDTTTCTIVVAGTPVTLYCGSCGNYGYSSGGSGNGTVGTSYTSTLSVSGGSSPYTYSLVSGSLPPGLTLNTSTGVISGTPTTAGTYTFTSKVVDKYGNSDTATCTIKIIGATINLTCGACGSNSTATVGTSYSENVSVSGGSSPYVYSLASGSLPPGLSLNTSSGVISGTPTTAGTYTFTTKVVDKNGNTDTATCTIKVVTPPVELQSGNCGQDKAYTGHGYSANLQATGGSGNYTYSITNGSLPPGLSFNSKTGGISGTPTQSGTWVFTGKVTDSQGNSDTTNCFIQVCN